MLDEAWTTKTGAGYPTRRKAETAHLWRIQLAGRHPHLDDGQDEEQRHLHQLLGRTAGEAVPEKASGFGDG